jgi:hypothetical protein
MAGSGTMWAAQIRYAAPIKVVPQCHSPITKVGKLGTIAIRSQIDRSDAFLVSGGSHRRHPAGGLLGAAVRETTGGPSLFRTPFQNTYCTVHRNLFGFIHCAFAHEPPLFCSRRREIRTPHSSFWVACFIALFVLPRSAVAQDVIGRAPAGETAVVAQKIIGNDFDKRWQGWAKAPDLRMTEREKRDFEYKLRCQPSEYKDSLGVTHLKYAHPDCEGRILK